MSRLLPSSLVGRTLRIGSTMQLLILGFNASRRVFTVVNTYTQAKHEEPASEVYRAIHDPLLSRLIRLE